MIRIGIVGCGRILAAHLRGYRLLRAAGVDTFRITALCARRPDDALSYVRRGHGPAQRPPVSNIPGDVLGIGDEYLSDFQGDVEPEIYTDYREMIARGPIDAVNDFTSHGLHHQVAFAAFDHRKHLLSQKPLAVSVLAAQQMCARAEAANRVFGVFENFRFLPQTRHLNWLFNVGPGGELQMILIGYLASWWAPNRIVAETPWRHRRDEAGGISLDFGVHFFDQIRHVVGEIRTVTAQTAIVERQRVTVDRNGNLVDRIACDADDTFFAAFDTERGVVGHLAASWAGHGGATTIGAGSVYYGSKTRVNGTAVTFDDGTSADLGQFYAQHASSAQREGDFPLGLDDSFALAQLDWLEAVRLKRQPQTSGREGLRDLAASFAILESATAGRRVEVAEVLDGHLDVYQRPINRRYELA
ncbi:MAG TPA: Gfo/Idh/MocA family oxidoreductase [Pirellulales bacterium]|jgi:predicted dehydrogenase|nr:Gfo/Idh/MocA family oxidoreductase [Pirellulales bacterium]